MPGVQLIEKEEKLTFSPGSELKIVYTNKQLQKKHALITPGPSPNHFYAIFQDDDVDFELEINNQNSRHRSLCLTLQVHGKQESFLVEKNTRVFLQTLESYGKKFHFLSQASQQAKTLVSTYAHRHDLSYHGASVGVSHLQFKIEFSKLQIPPIKIYVRTETKLVEFFVDEFMSVNDLKFLIAQKQGLDLNSFSLIYQGQEMVGERGIQNYGVGAESTIYLISKPRDYNFQTNFRQCPRIVTTDSMVIGQEGVVGVGERGLVCFAENCSQKFTPAFFEPDESIKIKPFIIELRLIPRFSLVD